MSIEGLQKNRESEIAELRKRLLRAAWVCHKRGHSSKHGLLQFFTNKAGSGKV